jgi:hypothetical protein
VARPGASSTCPGEPLKCSSCRPSPAPQGGPHARALCPHLRLLRRAAAPNLSQADADGCLWICINPDCPELCAGELETEDLAGGGVSTSWGTGSDVEDQALAGRLVRLIDFYEDTVEELRAECGGEGEEGADASGGGAAAPPLAGSRERALADLASLRRQVRELRRSALAAAAADQLGLELIVSYHSNEFAEAQDAQRLLAAAAALCGAAGHAAADAEERLAGIDPKLPGLLREGQR